MSGNAKQTNKQKKHATMYSYDLWNYDKEKGVLLDAVCVYIMRNLQMY